MHAAALHQPAVYAPYSPPLTHRRHRQVAAQAAAVEELTKVHPPGGGDELFQTACGARRFQQSSTLHFCSIQFPERNNQCQARRFKTLIAYNIVAMLT
jgi:hypothetical protein